MIQPYTNIDIADVKAQIMRLIGKVFAAHPTHAGINVRQNAPAVGYGQTRCLLLVHLDMALAMGGSYILDLAAIQTFLSFLLDNMFVASGESMLRQIIGIPMGTNCASLLAIAQCMSWLVWRGLLLSCRMHKVRSLREIRLERS